jgi:hypothetical protein
MKRPLRGLLKINHWAVPARQTIPYAGAGGVTTGIGATGATGIGATGATTIGATGTGTPIEKKKGSSSI